MLEKENSTDQSVSSNDDLDLLVMYDDYLDRWIEVDKELRSFEEFVKDYYENLELQNV